MRCILLSGGGGLRLWPLSRRNYPKQFLRVDGDELTLFQRAIVRNLDIFDDIEVITNARYRYMTAYQAAACTDEPVRLVLEPKGRNTAPAIAIAALLCRPDEICLVAPTDAMIGNANAYHSALGEARRLAEAGSIVMFGIEPNMPHTGYGYIQHEGEDVVAFKEKPDEETARGYLESGDYLWNSGMFMFRADVMIGELGRTRPDILDACVELVEGLEDEEASPLALPAEAMARIPEESIDYAVIERTRRIKVVPARFGWSDVGSLEVLTDLTEPDVDGNRADGGGIVLNGCRNVSVTSTDPSRLVVANGLDDVIAVNTANAVYITRRGDSQAIKGIIGANEEAYGPFFDESVRSYRPWGYYEVLVGAPRYKVKRIKVFPGMRISLQRHFKRSEHWTVARGTATITLGERTMRVEANESAYIPVGMLHRLANDTDDDLEIIEVSIGEELTENDIERLEDDYGR